VRVAALSAARDEDQVGKQRGLTDRVVARVGPFDELDGGARLELLSLVVAQRRVLRSAEDHPSPDASLAQYAGERPALLEILAVRAHRRAERSSVGLLQLRGPRAAVLGRD